MVYPLNSLPRPPLLHRLKSTAELGPTAPLITYYSQGCQPAYKSTAFLRSVWLQALLRLVVILEMATTPKNRSLLPLLSPEALPAVPVVSLLGTGDPGLVFTFACEQQRRKEKHGSDSINFKVFPLPRRRQN